MKATYPVHLTIVYRRSYEEYQVRVSFDGKDNENAGYFTSDKQDAIDTQKAMVERFFITYGENVTYSDKIIRRN